MARWDRSAGDATSRLGSPTEPAGAGRIASPAPLERHRRLARWQQRFVAAGSADRSERASLLAAFGFAQADLAAAGAGFDDLWALVGFFVADGTYDERGVVAWLGSPRPELDGRRPLDLLAAGGALERVRRAADGHLVMAGMSADDLVPLPPARSARRGGR